MFFVSCSFCLLLSSHAGLDDHKCNVQRGATDTVLLQRQASPHVHSAASFVEDLFFPVVENSTLRTELATAVPDLDKISDGVLAQLVLGRHLAQNTVEDFAAMDASKSNNDILALRTDLKSLKCKLDVEMMTGELRVQMPLGALPCCPTFPDCRAPACTEADARPQQPVCTRRPWTEDYAYLTHPDVWPAYFGYGGAYGLDIDKISDVLLHTLGCFDAACNTTASRTYPFDLFVDLGANSGSVTAKATKLAFAKDFILVEADPGFKTYFNKERFGNPQYAEKFFNTEVHKFDGAVPPRHEFVTATVSDQTTGKARAPGCTRIDMDAGLSECPEGDPEWLVEYARLDDIIPGMLSPSFQNVFMQAQSAFVKVDTEGYDGLVLSGMSRLLSETRGFYPNGQPKHLVNFLYFEWSQQMMDHAAAKRNLTNYDMSFVNSMLEGLGFEIYMIGPRLLPVSGPMNSKYSEFFKSPHGMGSTEEPQNKRLVDLMMNCHTFVPCGDVFAIRASHPNAAEVQLALGACKESKDTTLGK